MNRRKIPKFKLPHTLVIMFCLVVFVYILSLLIPAGEFQRVEKEFEGTKRIITVPGTYAELEKRYLGPEWLVISPARGFADGLLIIYVVLVFGGTFTIIQKTQAIDSGIQKLSRFFSSRPKLRKMLIPALMLVFSIAGSTYGMCEENIIFVLIFIPLALSLGYDSIVGISIPFVGAAAGFAAACFNPFTVGIAQGFSELPLYSGLIYRFILWILGTVIATIYVVVYAEKIRKDPKKSPVYEIDQIRGYQFSPAQDEQDKKLPWGWTQKAVLLILFGGIVWLVYGVLVKKWYIEEIADLFLAIGILSGIIGRMKPDEIAKNFVEGAKDMMNVAFIIAFGRAVLIILQEALVLDTVLHYAATMVSAMPRILTAQIMFLVQTVINFFIHSGTAQAALTMPILAPLSDLVGITRQTTVLAFQLCEFVNPILPTSAVTMGVLGVARMPWEKWAKWFLPLMLILIVFSLIALIPPVLTNWGPF